MRNCVKPRKGSSGYQLFGAAFVALVSGRYGPTSAYRLARGIMKKLSLLNILGASAAVGAGIYGAHALTAWLRYGHTRRASAKDADTLLDRYMPEYDVVERHSIEIDAPAGVVLGAACDFDLEGSRLARMIFRSRELLLKARPATDPLPQGLLAKTKALGWGQLAEVFDREIVMGAATQPWEANPVFRPLPPEEFCAFREPGFVKIAWTLRADPVSATKSIFRTETRVVACDPSAKARFRKYWAFLSPGIILIRVAMLRSLKREAERQVHGVPLEPASRGRQSVSRSASR
jgi:hypothetical protein